MDKRSLLYEKLYRRKNSPTEGGKNRDLEPFHLTSVLRLSASDGSYLYRGVILEYSVLT